jgi:tRNA (adenine37-N6)-methyltransferase
MLDASPLIDIKPYIPKFDYIADATHEWVAYVKMRPKPGARE